MSDLLNRFGIGQRVQIYINHNNTPHGVITEKGIDYLMIDEDDTIKNSKIIIPLSQIQHIREL